MMLYSETSGNGPELVLLHGWGMHSGVWGAVLPGLAGGYRVTRIDLPGHGRSRVAPGLGLEGLASAVLESVPDNAVWIGWSLGGLVAMQAALMDGGSCFGLVPVACSPRFVQGDGWSHAMSPEVLSAFANALQDDYRATLQRFLALQARGSEQANGVLRQLRSELALYEPDRSTLRDGLDVLASTNLVSQLCKIRCPCLFLMGERDTLVPPDAAWAAARQMPEAVVSVIRGAGHAPFLSHPDEFVSLLQSFLEQREFAGKRHG